MRLRLLLYVPITCCWVNAVVAQRMIGIQSGPLFFQGLSGGSIQRLNNTGSYTIGVQFLDGQVGETGVRFGLDLYRRIYDLKARQPLNSRMIEEVRCASSLMQFSLEVRWPISEELPVYFDLGPVIGAEVHEKRSGIVYDGDLIFGREDAVVIEEVESGFAIRDIRLRIGLSMEFPLGGEWQLTAGAHMGPGFTTWARECGYLTLDGQLRAGVVYAFGNNPARPPRKG